MSKNDKPSAPQPRPTPVQKGYKPKHVTAGYNPNSKRGHQPSGKATPTKPPSNPPNQPSGGKK